MEYYPIDFRASSLGSSSESNDMEYVTMEEMDDASGGWRPELTRGVKKTTSLRRGAAGYAELLQSAVVASIEFRRGSQEIPADPPPAAMTVAGGGAGLMMSPSTNKRTRCHHPEFPRKSSASQRHSLAAQYPPRAYGCPLQPDRFYLG
jgi:hypothetical protein